MSDERPPPDDASAPDDRPRDVVLVKGPTERGVSVVRVRSEEGGEDQVEVGELRPVEEGKPIHGDVLKLTPRPEHPRVFDAEVLASAPKRRSAPTAESASALAHKGPARVTTDAYRENWDGIFGARRPQGPPS